MRLIDMQSNCIADAADRTSNEVPASTSPRFIGGSAHPPPLMVVIHQIRLSMNMNVEYLTASTLTR